MTRLSEKAMLVSLTIHMWQARRVDKRASREVAQNHGSDESMGRYSKSLIDPAALAGISRAARAIREYHDSRTLPWQQDGIRILPSELYLEYTGEIRRRESDMQIEVSRFLADYPSLVSDARAKLNGLFRAEEYPAPIDLQNRYGITLSIDPIPDSGDWRVSMADADADRIRQDIERRSRESLQAAMRDCWTRLHDGLDRAVRVLSADAPRIHDSMLATLQDLAAILPRMDLTGDARLRESCELLSSRIADLDSDTLRTSEESRAAVISIASHVQDTAAGVLADMAALYGGDAR